MELTRLFSGDVDKIFEAIDAIEKIGRKAERASLVRGEWSFGDAAAPSRFWDKCRRAAACHCWEWQAGTRSSGEYGAFHFEGKEWSAHRYSYHLFKGAIEDGMHIDHLCREKLCVNPSHLEQVTPEENAHRGVPAGVHRFLAGLRQRTNMKEKCNYGHPFTEENTYFTKRSYYCRACARIAVQKKRQGVPV